MRVAPYLIVLSASVTLIVLAPLSQGGYIVESTAGAERTLTGFRVVS